MIKAADMLIARRADTRARADFATWKMLAKLNGASSLPEDARNFLDRYKALLNEMNEAEASEATINLIYTSYYGSMGGAGAAPAVPAKSTERKADNVTALKRRTPKAPKPANAPAVQPRLPVGLIFACLVIVYVAIRYLWT